MPRAYKEKGTSKAKNEGKGDLKGQNEGNRPLKILAAQKIA